MLRAKRIQISNKTTKLIQSNNKGTIMNSWIPTKKNIQDANFNRDASIDQYTVMKKLRIFLMFLAGWLPIMVILALTR